MLYRFSPGSLCARSFFTAILLMAVLLFTLVLQAEGAMSGKPEMEPGQNGVYIYFSLANRHNAPSKEARDIFDCTDKIFTVVELDDYQRGRHQLSVRWIDPADQTREKTEYPFTISSDQTRLWAWLSLSRARGAGMLQWINPAAGLEEFIGPWQVEVRIDNKLIGKGQFEVSC